MPTVMPALSDSQYLLPELVVGRLNVSVIFRSLEDAWCEYARRSLPVLPSQVAAVVHPLRVVAAETAVPVQLRTSLGPVQIHTINLWCYNL
jgi:hypothetical protein